MSHPTVSRLILASMLLFCFSCSDRAVPGNDAGASTADGGRKDGPSGKDISDKREKGISPDKTKWSCQAMSTEFEKNLLLAKVCNPAVSMIQCSIKYNNHLPCPCPTFINPANKNSISDMASLQKDWNSRSCSAGWPCPAMPCANPKSGYCEPTPPGSKVPGLCKDSFK